MSESHQQEERLFADALALPAGERSAFLVRACAGDEELQQRMEALLRADAETGDLLETPLLLEPVAEQLSLETSIPAEGPGSRIGRYQLIEKIGEGGCGIVYLAEQAEPVRRPVALKIIKLGMDTRSVIARFEAERQALALMDHPNIARVFDAGATEHGRPFFVMELVPGMRITDYCDRHRLPTEARLRLFIQVCHAVQHAHQKGVIHRDLKPSNILVTLHDGLPVPKVIDFGIAKATQGRLTDHTLFTAYEQFIGTPAYMSPEQAELSGVDIDTRSDIYSLGVLLYELLTGRPPIDTPQLLKAGVDEVRRHIRETEPSRPSARLRTFDRLELTAVAGRRGSEPAKLVHELRGDLDWIVMRCLEKERARRYETVDGLAGDVECYLKNEPVAARPPSRTYVLWKFVRRHRLAFAAGGAIAVALLLGFTISLVLFFRERKALERAVLAEQVQIQLRQQAERGERKVQTEAARSAQVARFMKEMLDGVGPAVARGRDTKLLRDIVDATALRLDQELKDQPEVEADLRQTVGNVYQSIGEVARSIEMLKIAVALRRQADSSPSVALADALVELGDAVQWHAGWREGMVFYWEALAIQQKLLGFENLKVAETQAKLSHPLSMMGQIAEAKGLLYEALAIQKKLLGPADPAIAATESYLGFVLRQAHEYPAAEAAFRRALALYRPERAEKNTPKDYILWQLGAVLRAEGQPAEAEKALRAALAIERGMLNDDNPRLFGTLHDLGQVFAAQDRLPEAENIRREQIALMRKLTAREPTNHGFAANLGDAIVGLGDLLLRQQRYPEAELILREGVALRRAPISALGQRELIQALDFFGDALLRQDKLSAAEPAYREALAREEATPDERIYPVMCGLAEALDRQGKTGERQAVWAEAIACGQASPAAPEEEGSGGFAIFVTMAAIDCGSPALAEPLARDGLARWGKAAPDDWRAFAFQSLLGAALAEQKRPTEAEPLLLAGFAGVRARRAMNRPETGPFLRFTVQHVVQMYADLGRPEQAAEWQRRQREVDPAAKP